MVSSAVNRQGNVGEFSSVWRVLCYVVAGVSGRRVVHRSDPVVAVNTSWQRGKTSSTGHRLGFAQEYTGRQRQHSACTTMVFTHAQMIFFFL